MVNQVVDELTGLRNPETMITVIIVIFGLGFLFFCAMAIAAYMEGG